MTALSARALVAGRLPYHCGWNSLFLNPGAQILPAPFFSVGGSLGLRTRMRRVVALSFAQISYCSCHYTPLIAFSPRLWTSEDFCANRPRREVMT